MSAYKKLNRQDVYITSYTAKKDWEVVSSGGAFSFGFSQGFDIYLDELGNVGINLLSVVERGTDSSNLIRYTEPNYYYRSLYQLYYSNFSGSVISGSFDNYFQSSFESDQDTSGTGCDGSFSLGFSFGYDIYVEGTGRTRTLATSSSLFTIPRDLIGLRIHPSSVTLTVLSGSVSASIIDDGEGKLLIADSNLSSGCNNVGDIIYSHGNLVFTDETIANMVYDFGTITGSWQSTQPILEANYFCKLRDYEFNYTLNPTAQISGSKGTLADNVTGSYFTPYITSIGLYNDANELLAVAKLGQPVPKSPDTEMTFAIKLDL